MSFYSKLFKLLLITLLFTFFFVHPVFANPTVSVSGHITDRDNNPIPGISVHLDGQQTSSVTDNTGAYSLQAESGYPYRIDMQGGNSPYLPQSYLMLSDVNIFNQDTILDMRFPGNTVTTHVQDNCGNPVEDVSITVIPFDNIPLTLTTSEGSLSTTVYHQARSYGTTDSSGNTSAGVFPFSYFYDGIYRSYQILATPPTGSPFIESYNNFISKITSDVNTTVTLLNANDVAPTVNQISSSASQIAINNSLSITGNFTDPDQCDIHTAVVDWGDGTSSTGTVTESNGSGSINASHSYTIPGSYTITLTVYDQNNLPNSSSINVSVIKQIVALDPAQIWVSKGALDIGLKVDLLAEVYKNTSWVSSGQLNSVDLGTLGGGFTVAQLQTIPFNSFPPVDFPSGSSLKIKVSARNACSGSLRNSGTFTLWFNDSAANSRFGATVGTTGSNYYLLTGFNLRTSAGSGPQQSINVAAGAQCSPFKPFGTWTITPSAY